MGLTVGLTALLFDEVLEHSAQLVFLNTPISGLPSCDLVFDKSSTIVPVTLVFDDKDAGEIVAVDALVNGAIICTLPLPAMLGILFVCPIAELKITDTIPSPALFARLEAQYDTNTARPLVGQNRGGWAVAKHDESGMSGINEHMQHAISNSAFSSAKLQSGYKEIIGVKTSFVQADKLHTNTSGTFERSEHRPMQAATLYNDAKRMRRVLVTAFQAADKAQNPMNRQRHQDARRDRVLSYSTWSAAMQSCSSNTDSLASAVLAIKNWRHRQQEAIRPYAGTSKHQLIPIVSCSQNKHLLFDTSWSNSPVLIFSCEHQTSLPFSRIVILASRAYVTINNIILRRVDGDIPIAAYSFAMSLDYQSWTWSWSASIELVSLPLITPGSDGQPVEVEAIINGAPYRLCAEGFGSQRGFAKSRVGIKGRGLAAVLDTPYAPVLNFASASDRTAQQLMLDALTINGVSIGWELDWGLTDWLVPGNTWTHQGAYISAITAIAQAAGGYVQPHNTSKTLRILPGYPAAPWAWGDVMPDFELPSAVVTVEGIDWTRKPDYNRVFVSGMNNGVLGQVTRAGTAGDSVAPMITDALITHADAARQRGLSVLSDTGAQERINLTLPVLAETGLITPGQFVRYVDAGRTTRIGLVRGTNLTWALPKMRQTLSIETHV